MAGADREGLMAAAALGRGFSGVLAVLALLICGACATARRALPAAAEEEFVALDAGGRAYFFCDVPLARPVLDLVSIGGMSVNEGGRALDMTQSAAAAFYPAGDTRRFLIATQGSYPKGRINLYFTLSREWKRVVSPAGGKYWRSEAKGLSLSIDNTGALLAGGDPYPRRGAVAVPREYAAIRRGAALAGWILDAAAPINGYLEAMQMPIQIPADRAFFALYPAGEGSGASGGPASYEAVVRLETPSASHVQALAAMISLLRALGAGMSVADERVSLLMDIFLAHPPEQDGSSLILRTGALEPERIALLFNTFPVY